MNDCKYVKPDGERCQAKAMKESEYCFTHNPDTQIEKQLAVVKGGLAKKKVKLDLKPLSIKNPQEVGGLLEDTINGVRSGEIPPNIANTIGYLAGHALKAFEASNLDQRVEMVESILLERKKAIRRR